MGISCNILCYTAAALVLYVSVSNACHNAAHTKPTAPLDFSGRKKRSADCANCAEDVDEELSAFFTECMERKRPQQFKSWRGVVNFVLRDSLWYTATDRSYCSGRKDSAKCWQRRVMYLLRYDSMIVEPTKSCISEYDRSIKDLYGTEFEEFYVNNFDSYDSSSSMGEFHQLMKTAQHTIDSAMDLIREKGATIKKRLCPSKFNKGFYQKCAASSFNSKTHSISDQFSPSQLFDRTSVFDFLNTDFTSCRISTKDQNGTTLYQEDCPLSETATESTSLVHSDIAIVTPCLVYDYRSIVRSNSPGYSLITSCYENEGSTLTQSETATSPEAPLTVPTPILENSILHKNFKNKKRIGSCGMLSKWTSYHNLGPPDEIGDTETLEGLLKFYPGAACENPTAVEARTVTDNSSGDDVFLSLTDGLRCLHVMQKGRSCSDYKIRFCCRIINFWAK